MSGKKLAFLLGRTILGGYFVYSGIHHFQERRKIAQYAGSKKVPVPHAAVLATGALITAGGASLILGLRPRLGALAVIAFLAGVSPMMHNFWSIEDPNQRMNEMTNFTKDLALAGAALALIGVEEWPLSVAPGQSDVERVARSVRKLAA